MLKLVLERGQILMVAVQLRLYLRGASQLLAELFLNFSELIFDDRQNVSAGD